MKTLYLTASLLFASAVLVKAQIVINEIIPPSTVEIKNLGGSTVNIASYWLCERPTYVQLSNTTVLCGDLNLAAGAIVAVNASPINLSASNDDLALYTSSNFDSPAAIVDYVDWGTGCPHDGVSGRHDVAVAAGIWTDGDCVDDWTGCSSLEYDGSGNSSSDWMPQNNPTSPCMENSLDGCAAGGCVIDDIGLANVNCDDNNTPTDDSDDIITFTLNPSGSQTAATYNVSVSSGSVNPTSGIFGMAVNFSLQAGSAGSGNVTITVTDADEAGCMASEMLFDPGSCSAACDLISSGLAGVACDDNGSDADPSDDVITFFLDPQGINTAAAYSVSVNQGSINPTGANYGPSTMFTLQAGSAGSGNVTVTITDDGDNSCTIDALINDPGSCSMGCILETTGLSNIGCDNNGTPLNPADDRITFDLNPIGVNLGASYNVVAGVGNVTPSGAPYGGTTSFMLDPGTAGSGNVDITVFDSNDPSCIVEAQISDPGTCSPCTVDGGVIMADGSTTVCLSDTIQDLVNFDVTTASGPNTQWVITSPNGTILSLPAAPPFDFSNADPGVCLVWHLSYADGLTGLAVGNNTDDLEGCFDFSNSVPVTKNEPDGGVISTSDPTTVCAGDGMPDTINVNLAGAAGSMMAWVITNTAGEILSLPAGPPFDFEGSGPGVSDIWHISYEAGLTGLAVGNNLSALMGCFDLSNNIRVTRFFPNGGMISTDDPTQLCVDDGVADTLDVTLSGNTGPMNGWIITTIDSMIEQLPAGPPFDFESSGPGISRIWHISYDGVVNGLEVDGNLQDLIGCFDLSNSITVVRDTGMNCNPCTVDGGVLQTTDSLNVCVGDGNPDLIDAMLSGNSGPENSWIITDSMGMILSLPSGPPFDFEDAGTGVCLIWHVSYEPGLMGLEVGNSLGDLIGCFNLSNAIDVTKLMPQGGSISTMDTTTFCVDDGVNDFVNVALTGATGGNSGWVITNIAGDILSLPASPPFNFEGTGAGDCQIWHISYEDGLTGLAVGNNVSDLAGCYDLSNAITVMRLTGDDCPEDCVVDGGVITTNSDTVICVGEGTIDTVEIFHTGATGELMTYVITDENGIILGHVPSTNTVFTFENGGPGICDIYLVSYEDGLEGFEEGEDIDDLEGCYDLSNSITVIRLSGDDCESAASHPGLERLVKIYPNPTSGDVFVDVGNLKVNNIYVFDTDGRVVNTGNTILNNNTIQLGDAPGMYVLVFYTDQGVAAKRVVKLGD